MKKWRIIPVLLLCLVLAGSIACNPFGGEEEVSENLIEVVRGNLTITVSGSGNIEVSKDVELAFGSGGKIETIYVEEGDEVSEGDVLAKLDTDVLKLALTEARVAYYNAQVAVIEAEASVTQAEVAITQAEINLKNAEIALESAEDTYVWPEEIFTARQNVWAAEREVREAQAMLRGEEAVYDSRTGALLYYKQLKTAYDLKYWTDKLAEAEEKLRTYQVNLDALLTESAVDTSVSEAEAKLTWYQDQLNILLAQYDALTQEREPTGSEKAEVEERIATMRMKVELAQEEIEDAQNEQEEVVTKKHQVEYAQQSLELAKQSLELARHSPELNRQSVELAKQSLEQAQKQLDEATITAQFDGIVARIYADDGDVIPPPSLTSTPIIKLIDPSNLELNVEVDEIDVPGVKKGQKVIIDVDALPSIPIEGEVDFIFPTANEESGLVTYKVKIDFAIPEGSGLRGGMSATADIVIEERSDVLLVPGRAIKQDSEGNSIVEVMVNQQIEERTVVTGISDGFQTEILDGLEEGEVIERRAKPK
ncbi:efflux RND transporter periplasmic adaptor subunit [Chloroflexota bacterium]